MELDIIFIIILLLLSGFFSGSEIAFVVANKLKIELRARKNKLAAKEAHYFMNHPHEFFSTILISNNVINIAFASIITVLLFEYFQFSDLTILITSSLLLLFFGELIPKYIARETSDIFVLISSVPIRIISVLLYPFVKITSMFSNKLTELANFKEENISLIFKKEDIQELLEESTEAGSMEEDTTDIINKVMELGDQKIYEAMSPRTDIIGVEYNTPIDEVINVFTSSGYSKIPVYEETIDNIKGWVHAYDMFKNPDDLKQVMRDIIFIPDTKKTLEMLNEFLDKRVSIAVVIDEFGGTAGLVTVEDIIEEMVGEITDEHDTEDIICRKIDENNYLVSGKAEIDFLNEQFDLKIPDGEYETIGGYITNSLGIIPQKGEYHTIDNYLIYVVKSDKTKIDLIKITVFAENDL
ncbi:MAG: hemolysin family protein [Ignavibacteria bacterium]|jgi:CBS domain containing-hemolysin-like protein